MPETSPRPWLSLLALLALLALGCAGSPTPASGVSAASPPAALAAPTSFAAPVLAPTLVDAVDAGAPAIAPRPARRAKVLLEDDALGVATPLVDAVVGGLPVQLIVDTGASHHIIAGWVAREIGAAPSARAGAAAAHGGDAVAIFRLDGVSIKISGYGKVDAPSLFVTEVPSDVRRRGIGGVLSPQALVTPGRAVLLDLAGGTLGEAAEGEASRWIEAKGTPFDGVRACPGAGAGALVAQATIDGEETALQLDTGSSTSSVALESALGKRLAKRSKGTNTQLTASGLHTVPTVAGAVVKLGSFVSEVNLDLIPRTPARGCGDGYVGMDVLRSCAVLIGAAGARLVCGARR